MDQSIIELYDEYTHKPLPRRVFLSRLSVLAGGSAAAASLLPLLENNYAHAAMIDPGDSRLETSTITFEGASGPVKAYLARPKGASALPSVVVIHENRGLNPHIQDVARRMALEGFVAMAPDFLSPMGGTPSNEDTARGMFRELNMGVTVQNGVAAVSYLKSQSTTTGKVGAVGFCWGGGMVNQLAVNAPDLAAGVVYYGRQPAASDVDKIEAKLMIHYAGLDQRINGGAAAYEDALKKSGVDYQQFMYEGANHAFNNDTNGARYNPDAAKLAWGRTVGFLKENLS